ncbi:hypothetical protein FA95DRAFT_1554134 [Auriscalpium vulgare]|uniref:Uncharacterized protein n=1 Tax=Auriscalpium vulgare TaxID=40419 RepID=A0ACB8S7I0_9AGAM|nr:hypothetical protein FA95DRAFT_1554134 [Auriscalpium vulgare]
MGLLDNIRWSPKPPAQALPSIDSSAALPIASEPPAAATTELPVSTAAPSTASHTTEAPSTAAKPPRWSFQRTLDLFSPQKNEHKPALSLAQDQTKREHAAHAAQAPKAKRPAANKSDRRAKQSALVVRELIVGSPAGGTRGVEVTDKALVKKAKPTQGVSRDVVNRVKTQLLAPKAANRVIAQLRALPAVDAPDAPNEGASNVLPIHAVCLPYTESETQEKHFSLLESAAATSSVATATLSSISSAFADLRLVSLVSAPNFGLGASAEAEGILAGAVPTAETIIEGAEQITPQLMALGYATGKAVIPDHTGVYPPTDRMSVLTYWWGLELVLPPPSIAYLDNTQSISHTVMNFLTALGMLNNGVREILPFVRYMSQFVDFEFNQIRGQDQGQGVVCAATWIMPAAMVPRPWDFPAPPASEPDTAADAPSVEPVNGKPSQVTSPAPVLSPGAPPQSPAPIESSPEKRAGPNDTPSPLVTPPIAVFPAPGVSVAVASGA